tara:strand:- start:3077 stop:3760 length:684 start_codon:yes stop_codon:yes gene_type:complete
MPRLVVVTGIWRSGTTLMSCMLRWALPECMWWNHEISALDQEVASTFATMLPEARRGGQSIVITKDPRDIHKIDEIRSMYGADNVVFIAMIRDPRGALLSKHDACPERGYFMDGARYLEAAEAVEQLKGGNFVIPSYERLICEPAEVQRNISVFGQILFQRRFEDFHEMSDEIGEGYLGAMHGLRSLSTETISRHVQEKNRARLADQFRRYPKLAHYAKLWYGDTWP